MGKLIHNGITYAEVNHGAVSSKYVNIATGNNIGSGFYVVDNYISNFTSSYPCFPLTSAGTAPVYDLTKSYHIHIRTRCSSLITRSQVLIGENSNYFRAPSVEFSPSSSETFLWAGYTPSTNQWLYSLTIDKSEMSLNPDIYYEIDYNYDSINHIFSLTADDGTGVITKQTSVSGTFPFQSSYTMTLGGISRSSNHNAINCTIDMRNTYWEEDGNLLWGFKAD